VTRKARRKNVVGRRVAEARKSRSPRLTQEDLSGKLARVGIQLDRAAVAKIENGHRYVLDYELKALAEVLGADANWFLGVGKK
jgi:transcriptional regulator with XRE-family HTH domain